MKIKLAQFASFVSKIDRRHLQLAYLVIALAVYIVSQSPLDGGTGPF